jgi:hypothetical protein
MSEANKIPKQETKKLKDLFNMKFIIPKYQRPYKWDSEKVIQLLEDIFEFVIIQKNVYRIGNIIVHEDSEELNIVDGQQRLTTLSLILLCLNENEKLLLKDDIKYNSKISFSNIQKNHGIINKWLSARFPGEEKKDVFLATIKEKCEFVVFTVFGQDEAFQLFDSQNARGKTLEPYDLLKAFHLREMENELSDNKMKCVLLWEKAVEKGELKPILEDNLFRIRKWTKGERIYNLSKNEIDEYKGISLHKIQKYNFEKSARLLDGYIEELQRDKCLKTFQEHSFPFSITMPIMNGKRFFEYVQHYIILKNTLLKKDEKFKSFYKEYCEDYDGAKRSGDTKVKNLYENVLLFIADKYGISEIDSDLYKAIYKEVYLLRVQNPRIVLESILNYKNDIKLFKIINNSISLNKLEYLKYKIFEVNDKKEKTEQLVKGTLHIKNFINDTK